jgi:electron transport complex protein RnfG
MRETMKLIARLGIITVVTGLLLGVVYEVTKVPIQQQAQATEMAANQVVLEEADAFEPMQVQAGGVEKVSRGLRGGQPIGYAVTLSSDGYGGAVNMIVGLDLEGAVTGISIVSHAETPGLGSRITDDDFKDQFVGKSDQVSLGDDIDAVSGATRSSGAVVAGVNAALSYYEENLSGEEM